MARAAIETSTILGGKFRVIRQIGAGGMGAVYEVEHTLTRHRRALKLLHGEMANIPGIVTRFLREASAAGHIGNPHVIETFDAGQLDNGQPYIVMELLAGRTLAELLEQLPVLGLAETCDILIQACDGVSAAHASGIVHRDLKPENLFLLHGPRPFVKILDFGISKFDPALTGVQGITLDGSTLGTPYYMPPEQVRGDTSIDQLADVYALGVILYECVVGARPFEAETLPHLSLLIAEGNYVLPTERRPELPAEVDRVVRGAMAADRSQRYRSVDELRVKLEALRALGSASLSLHETLLAGSPEADLYPSFPPPGALPSSFPPGAYPSSPPAGRYFSSNPAPYHPSNPAPAHRPPGSVEPALGSIPEHTEAPLSHTHPEGERRTTRSGWLLLLTVVVVGVALFSWLRSPSDPNAIGAPPARAPEEGVAPEVSAGRAAEAEREPVTGTDSSPAPEPVVKPHVDPAEPEVPLAPRESTKGSTEPSRIQPAPRGAPTSRAREHGLLEENPF